MAAPRSNRAPGSWVNGYNRAMTTCPICLTSNDLVSDHDHVTGYSRERICRCCNAGLGMFKDNAAALRRAARYLEKHRAINRSETIHRHLRPSDLSPAVTAFAPQLSPRKGDNRLP